MSDTNNIVPIDEKELAQAREEAKTPRRFSLCDSGSRWNMTAKPTRS